jgi:hypothetical protein
VNGHRERGYSGWYWCAGKMPGPLKGLGAGENPAPSRLIYFR